MPFEQKSPRRIMLALDGDSQGLGPVAVLDRLPNSFDEVHVFTDEDALGLEESSLDLLQTWVSQMGFEVASLSIARLACWIDDLPTDAATQVEFAEQAFMDSRIARRVDRFLKHRKGGVVVAEQHLVALARLVVFYARSSVLEDPAPVERLLLERTVLRMSSIAVAGGKRRAELVADDSRSTWIPFLIQNAAFNATEPLLEAHGRTAALLESAVSDSARQRADFCDLNQWAIEDTGLSLRQQATVGFTALASSGALDGGRPKDSTALLPPGFCAELATRMGLAHAPGAQIRDAISGDRAWYAEKFRETESYVGLDPDAAAAGFNRVPFETKPFMRLADGRLMLWSPRSAVSWATDGFYYRALDAALARGQRAQFHGFWAFLVEQYVRDLFTSAYPWSDLPGSGVVHGEFEYGPRRRRVRTPDVMIDFGPDLVMVEVVSGRLSRQARITGDPDKITEDLVKMVAKKAQQLNRRLDDYWAGGFEVPGVDRAHVRRVWPIVVTGSGLVMNEPLWNELTDLMPGVFEQSSAQPLTVLGLGDVEQLVGLVESGWSVPRLLAEKTGAYRKLQWRRMVSDYPGMNHRRASFVVDRWERLWRRLATDLGWDPDQIDQSVLKAG